MKTIKFLLLALAATVLSATTMTSCTDYQDEIDGLDTRVTALEKLTGEINTNLTALTKIVKAMDDGDYITNVTKNADGCIITFAKAGAITIKDGKDGVDAQTPVITIDKDADGYYYWKLGGEWMTPRVRANGIDGQDATSPQVRINTTSNEWEISTDGGSTWTSTGVKATGKDGVNGSDGAPGAAGADAQSPIKSVVDGTDFVTITLSDDSVIKIPKSAAAAETVELRIANSGGNDYFTYMLPEQTGTFTLDKIGLTAAGIDKVLPDEGITATIEGNTVTIAKGSGWNAKRVNFLTTSDDMISVRFQTPDLYICVNGGLPNLLTSSNPVGVILSNRYNVFNVSFAYNAEWVDISKENDADYMYSVLSGLSSKYFSAFTVIETEVKDKGNILQPTESAAALAGTTFTKIGDSYRVTTVFDDSDLLTPPLPGDDALYRIRYDISITRNDGTVYKGAWANQVKK